MYIPAHQPGSTAAAAAAPAHSNDVVVLAAADAAPAGKLDFGSCCS